jgi:hypothetical protein
VRWEHGSLRGAPVACRTIVQATQVVFDGLGAIQLDSGGTRLIVVHEIGPRIAWFGSGDRNLLYWDPERAHRRGPWTLYGGHRLWLTRPGADESEETYTPDDRPCQVRSSPRALTVAAPPDRHRLVRALRVRHHRGGFVIEHRVTNTGDMLWSGGVWGLTCTAPRPSTVYAIPIGDDSAWDVVTIVTPRRWGGDHTSRLDDPQIELGRDHLRLRPAGRETKRMVRAPRGVVVMSDRRLGVAFVKRARFDPTRPYPLDTNLALYLAPGDTFVEMETMSPWQTLAPGQSAIHTERWSIEAPPSWAHRRG